MSEFPEPIDAEALDFVVQSLQRDGTPLVRVVWGPLHTVIGAEAARVAAGEIHKAAIVAEVDARLVSALRSRGVSDADIANLMREIGEWVVGETI